MIRAGLIAAAIVLCAQPVLAQQEGFFGSTAPERRFAKSFYDEHRESGIEYVSVSFRLRTLTLYPSQELHRSWAADESVARLALYGYAMKYLEEVRSIQKTREIKLSVRIRFPNARRSYETLVGELVSAEGLEGEFTLIRR